MGSITVGDSVDQFTFQAMVSKNKHKASTGLWKKEKVWVV